MDLNSDQLNIETPELVAIEMPLAGIGSRFIALLIDTLIWAAGLLVLAILAWLFRPAMQAFSNLSYQWTVAIVTLIMFLLNWGYFTIFEAFWNGRTPGKRVARIRVIQRSGRPIGIFESMARNFVRYVDQIPFFYAVGVITMFATRQHQRLGDLAAGTLVVRDREQETPLWGETGARTFTAPVFSPASAAPEPHLSLCLCRPPVSPGCLPRISRFSRAFSLGGLTCLFPPAKRWLNGSLPQSKRSRGWNCRLE